MNMFTDHRILPKPKNAVASYLLLGSLVALLSGCPSASAPSKPSSTSSSPPASSSQPSSPGTTGSIPGGQSNPPTGGTPSSGASLPSAGDAGESSGFEEPWADIGDDNGSSNANTGGDSDTSSVSNSGFELEPDFSDTEADTNNGQPGVFSDSKQVPGIEDASQGAETTDTGPVLTDSEQVAVLDEQLNSGTAEFDDMILKEREAIRRSASGYFPEAEDSDGNSDAYPGSVYDSGNSEASGDTDAVPSGPPGRKGDYSQTAASYPTPADIPEGNDDDVVARQLREAAIRESDPVLREKLWQEYRKYKGIK